MVRALVLALLVTAGGMAMAFELTSAAFEAGETIPVKHTCDGADVSPPLAWKHAPAATQSFALVCDDPDAPAGTWVHWVVYDLPPGAASLPEGVPPSATLADGSRQGVNDFRKTGYGGPCPPRGKPHRYVFRLYALDTALGLAPGASRSRLDEAMAGHVKASAELTGRYQRK
jgi:Raf kinase inhibitor-like YbhB/YbcL family protein